MFSGNKYKDLKSNSSYETVKELFRELNGFISLDKKKKLVKSFELKEIRHQVLNQDLKVYRWHNNNSNARKLGRFVSTEKITDPIEVRKLLALPESNQMLHLNEYIIKKGTKIFKGPVAPLNGQPGGGSQVFITGKLEDLLIPIKD